MGGAVDAHTRGSGCGRVVALARVFVAGGQGGGGYSNKMGGGG